MKPCLFVIRMFVDLLALREPFYELLRGFFSEAEAAT